MTEAAQVLVVGESLVDIVHRADGSVSETPGGSPANVALTLGRLGRRPRLLTSLGDDARGRAVSTWLEASGVVVRATLSARTSTATAHLDLHGAATYELAVDWSLDADELAPVHAVHVGSVAAVLEPGADVVWGIVAQHRGRALLSLDPNIRPTLVQDEHTVRRRIRDLLGAVDVVKASDEDVTWLRPGEDVVAVARDWVASGPVLVVVTLGAAGAIAVTAETEISVPGLPVDVVDTVGAGDTFMGALVDGLVSAGASGPVARDRLRELTRATLDGILHRSARAAAITVSREGADPPTRHELHGD